MKLYDKSCIVGKTFSKVPIAQEHFRKSCEEIFSVYTLRLPWIQLFLLVKNFSYFPFFIFAKEKVFCLMIYDNDINSLTTLSPQKFV